MVTLEQLPALLARMQADIVELQTLRQEVAALRARIPQWVTDKQAQKITGLSRDTLRRARQAIGSLIVYKQDHGLHYDYDSLLRHNESRAIGRGRPARLLTAKQP